MDMQGRPWQKTSFLVKRDYVAMAMGVAVKPYESFQVRCVHVFVYSCLCFIVSEVLFDIDFVALEVLLERELLGPSV